MSIKLTQDQVKKLKYRNDRDIDVVRPIGCKVVHIRYSWNPGTGFSSPTFCGHRLEPEPYPSGSLKPWTDDFCEKCVKRALKQSAS